MRRQERLELIKKIEEQTNSKILVYVTGDRMGLETRISSDVITFIYKHLDQIKHAQKINLLIYTTGGITISGFGIVNMIREYCEEFGIIIPFKCMSTGTLMALGANSIIMSKMGHLSPIDPSTGHPLGPEIPHPENPAIKNIMPINVEDVASFFDLARKEAKTNSEGELTKILLKLSESVHPLVLGAVNRSRNEIRFLAKTLLKQHIDDEEKINAIATTLIEKRFSHGYLIGRKEAKETLKLNVIDASENLMADIMKLYGEYAQLLKLDTPYNHETILGENDEVTTTLHKSIVESKDLTHTYSMRVKINRITLQSVQTGIPITQYQSALLKEEWMQNDEI